MKYFDEKWYREKFEPYYEYMEKNYEYYPQWFRDYDVAQKKTFLFRKAGIYDVYITEKDINIVATGIDYMVFKGYNLIFEDYESYSFPDDINEALYDVVAEEMYCDENSMELHLLLKDDDGRINDNFYVKCKRIGIEFEKNIIEKKLLRYLYRQERKRRKKNDEIFY